MSQLDREQSAEVLRLFELVTALPAQQHSTFLEQECPDPDVRREVRSLLESPTTDLGALHAAIAAESAAVARETDPDRRLIGVRVGPYRVESIIGHGGMGAVYRASRDDEEFHQQVAVKLVRAAMQSPESLRRFKQERQILARLSHPNIGRLLDGGSTQDGVPYLVMEFIEGETITEWCARQSLPLSTRLRLFLQVCDAVQSAHDSLIVHRDLKPGNILVTASGAPKLLDFGIAKMLVPDTENPATTTLGMPAMTPEYAAPEQVRGDAVSKAVDIYALGLILYELLTGHKAQNLPDHTPGAVARVVCQAEPVPPADLNPELAGDLDNIIRMAIRKEPDRRYGSVADLAGDIRRHLEGRPVSARPDTAVYRTTKFLRRNRSAVTVATASALLFSGAILAYWLVAPGRAPRVLHVTQLTRSGNLDVGGGLATNGSEVFFVERSPGQWKLARAPVEGGASQPFAVGLHYPQIHQISPDHTELLVLDGLGDEVQLWAVPVSGGEPRRIPGVLAHSASWSPDAKLIAFTNGSALFICNRDGSGVRKLLDAPGRPEHVRWAPPGSAAILRYDVSPVQANAWALWEAHSDGTHPHPFLPNWDSTSQHADCCGSWMPDGKYYLFTSLREGQTGIWMRRERSASAGLFTSRPMLIHSSPSLICCPASSLDGKRVFFISSQGRREYARYDSVRREFAPFLRGKSGRSVNFSRDGEWIAYTSWPHETLWRSRPDGSEELQLTPESVYAYEPHWSPDGAWICFTAIEPGQNQSARVVSSAGGSLERLVPAAIPSASPEWSPDSRSVLFRQDPPQEPSASGFYIMDWQTRKTTYLPGSQHWIRAIWHPDARRLAVIDGSQIQLFDIRTQQVKTLTTSTAVAGIVLSKSGKYVYYQDALVPEQPLFRVPTAGGKVEQVLSAKQIPQSDFTGYLLAGLGPDDAPIATLGRNNAEVYALELELP
jgi:serine/threonine-protein kinase